MTQFDAIYQLTATSLSKEEKIRLALQLQKDTKSSAEETDYIDYNHYVELLLNSGHFKSKPNDPIEQKKLNQILKNKDHDKSSRFSKTNI